MRSRIALAVTLLGALSISADAQGRGKGGRGAPPAQAAAVRRSTDVEIRIFREYYAAPSRKLKPMPPGIAKNLARGKPIPPGIERTRVPDDLLRRLPVRTGTRWLLLGDTVLLVDAGDLVVDFIRLIL